MKEIKAKVFAMYLGYPVKVKEGKDRVLIAVGGITDEPYIKLRFGANKGFTHAEFIGSSGSKLILRTTDQLTDEELIECYKIKWSINSGCEFKISRNVKEPICVHAFKDGRHFHFDQISEWCLSILQYQYLLSIGIDLPNYHLDGKTLIESGLAIRNNSLKTK